MANLKVWSPWGLMPRDVFEEDEFLSLSDQVQLDVYEEKNSVVVEAKIAGYSKDNVDISLENGRLTIKGNTKTKEEEEDKDKKYYKKEIRVTSFSRTVDLPVPVKPDKAKATFEDGLLKISIPKSEEAKPKSIKITEDK